MNYFDKDINATEVTANVDDKLVKLEEPVSLISADMFTNYGQEDNN